MTPPELAPAAFLVIIFTPLWVNFSGTDLAYFL